MEVVKKYTEPELVQLLRQRSQYAFVYLYDNYSGALLSIILNIVNEEELANDVLQEVFVKIWKQIDSYDSSKGRLFTWMLNIARNTGIDYLRSKQSKKENKNQTIEDVVYHVDSENQVKQPIDTIGLKSLVGTLSAELQLGVEYVYFEGYTQD